MSDGKINGALEALGITEREVPAIDLGGYRADLDRINRDYFEVEHPSQLDKGYQVVVRAHGRYRVALVVKVGRVNARVVYRAPAGRVHVQDARIGTHDELATWSPAVVAGAPRGLPGRPSSGWEGPADDDTSQAEIDRADEAHIRDVRGFNDDPGPYDGGGR